MQIRNHIMRHNGIGNVWHQHLPARPDTAVVVVTELSDNPGASITNCFERIVPRVLAAFLPLMPLKSVIWVEHYPSASRGGSLETYDLVAIEQYNGCLIPRWRSLGKEGFQQLIPARCRDGAVGIPRL